MYHGTGNKVLSHDGNPRVYTIFNSVLPSQIHICFYIGLLKYFTQITYITVSSQSARFEDNNTH